MRGSKQRETTEMCPASARAELPVKRPSTATVSPVGPPGAACGGLLRVAVLATPRSGNTWLRHLLSSLYELQNVVCDRPDEVDWGNLPARCVVQLHWLPQPALRETLDRNRVVPITIARHPLDVLISILHFATTWPKTALWAGGSAGDEQSIRGRCPLDREFLEYATGPRARTLLAISQAWWQAAACQIRYESLVSDTCAVLIRLATQLNQPAPSVIASAIAENTLERLRLLVSNQHYWTGSPGHWKHLLPAATARQIAAAHAATFDELGYDCDPDERLTLEQAHANWQNLEINSLRQELCSTRSQVLDLQRQLEEAERRITACQAHTTSLATQLEPLFDLGPRSVGLARRVHDAAARYPRAYLAFRRLFEPLTGRAVR
jgi:hypothetical protein